MVQERIDWLDTLSENTHQFKIAAVVNTLTNLGVFIDATFKDENNENTGSIVLGYIMTILMIILSMLKIKLLNNLYSIV